MKTLFNRLALGSGLLLAAAGGLDLVIQTPHNSYLFIAFVLFLIAFFGVIAPSAILYTIIKLAVRDAKTESAK